MPGEIPIGDGHDLDEDGFHDEDECERCLEANHSILSDCRCGRCCERLIVEATARDAVREPLIRVLGSKRRDDFTGEYPPDEEADWLLNGPGGPCVFLRREGDRGVCSIHDTRPFVCRVFSCDEPANQFETGT